jgi:hypothetical protein
MSTFQYLKESGDFRVDLMNRHIMGVCLILRLQWGLEGKTSALALAFPAIV